MQLIQQAYKTDTNDQKEMHRLVRDIYKEIGPVGGVVCNAGTSPACPTMALTVAGVQVQKPALEMTKEDFDKQMGANVWGVFCLAQAAVSYIPLAVSLL